MGRPIIKFSSFWSRHTSSPMMMTTIMIRGRFVGPSVLQTLKTVRTATKCHLQGETTFCLQISNQANIKDLIISSNKSSLRNFAKLQGPSPVQSQCILLFTQTNVTVSQQPLYGVNAIRSNLQNSMKCTQHSATQSNKSFVT